MTNDDYHQIPPITMLFIALIALCIALIVAGCTAPMIDNSRNYYSMQVSTNIINGFDILKEDSSRIEASVNGYKR